MFGKSSSDTLFFDAFRKHAEHTLEAALLVRRMFDQLDRAKEIAKEVVENEHAGDTITHETMRRLHETWITPFDRGDIHTLISRMDEVLDLTEAVAKRVVLFEIDEARPPVKDLADILVKSAQVTLEATKELPTLKKSPHLLELCRKLGDLENEADDLYRKAIAQLYKAGNDPLVVMKWRDIFDALETAMDKCNDVANVLEGVVLEYS